MKQEEIKAQLQQLTREKYEFQYHTFDMVKDLNVDMTNIDKQKTIALSLGEYFAQKLLDSCHASDFARDKLKVQWNDSPKPRFSTITRKLVESVLCLDKEYLALALHTFKDKIEEQKTIYNIQSSDDKNLTLSLYHIDIYNRDGQYDTAKNTQNGNRITKEYLDVFTDSIKEALKASTLEANEKIEKQRIIVNAITDFDRIANVSLKQNIANVRQKMSSESQEDNSNVLKNKNLI